MRAKAVGGLATSLLLPARALSIREYSRGYYELEIIKSAPIKALNGLSVVELVSMWLCMALPSKHFKGSIRCVAKSIYYYFLLLICRFVFCNNNIPVIKSTPGGAGNKKLLPGE